MRLPSFVAVFCVYLSSHAEAPADAPNPDVGFINKSFAYERRSGRQGATSRERGTSTP
jgi:hypothetical protein